MGDVVLRQGTRKDALPLARLMYEYDMYEHSLDTDSEPDSFKKHLKDVSSFLRTGKYKHTLIEENGKIVGLVNWTIDRANGVKRGCLCNLVITHSARGKGYGTILVDWLLAYFKKHKCTQVRSFVKFKNTKAQKFWKKQGFDFSEQGYHITKRL